MMRMAMFGMPGWAEAVVVVLVILLLFGARRLPDLARALGQSLNEFKKGRDEGAKAEADGDKGAESDAETSEKA